MPSALRANTTTAFSDLTFDHDRDSRFPLTGKHAETPCAGCHRPQRVGNGAPFIRYKPLDLTCGSCHTDYHQGQFLTIVPAASVLVQRFIDEDAVKSSRCPIVPYVAL